jgi:L,D-peptidoglycan transpeptidase YkuD (ErfK/YbiS/YcfS/YnhG family)
LKGVKQIHVYKNPRNPRRGLLVCGALKLPCALGRSGVRPRKMEGDGATPRGAMRILQGFYRADHGPRPHSVLKLRALKPRDGWCDAPAHRLYNRPVVLPFEASHEKMWRDDAVYDIVVDLDYNRGPIRKKRGSAIFMHCARPDFSPTEGCVALERGALIKLLKVIKAQALVHIH